MAGEDETYRRWVERQSCCSCLRQGPSVAHHRTGAGAGLKSHDKKSMPLCEACHRDFHDHRGVFRHWNKERKRDWQHRMVERMNEAFSRYRELLAQPLLQKANDDSKKVDLTGANDREGDNHNGELSVNPLGDADSD